MRPELPCLSPSADSVANSFAEMEAAIHNIQNGTKNSDGAANDWVLASSGVYKDVVHTG